MPPRTQTPLSLEGLGLLPLWNDRNTLPTREPSPKRLRASTSTSPTTLPLYRRSTLKALALKPTNAFMFRGLYPLYTRHVVESDYKMMEIRCGQPRCQHPPKLILCNLSGINNYQTHYRKAHLDILFSETKEKAAIAAKVVRAQAGGFFDLLVSDQTYG
jgi:hypothetical protein